MSDYCKEDQVDYDLKNGNFVVLERGIQFDMYVERILTFSDVEIIRMKRIAYNASTEWESEEIKSEDFKN